MKKFTIYGERCSGTKFLERLLIDNFNIEVTWKYEWKHFFGFEDLSNSDDTLFIGIARDPVDWVNSIYHTPHHVHPSITTNRELFISSEWWSTEQNKGVGNEHIHDRNMLTGERYKNIFELRKVKLNFLIEVMPKKVKNYVFIRYEDLINNYEKIMEMLKEKYCLEKKDNKNYITQKNKHSKYTPEYKGEEISCFFDSVEEKKAGYNI